MQDTTDQKPSTKNDIEKLQKEIDTLSRKISTKLATKADLKRESKAQWQGQLRLEEKIEKLEEANNKEFRSIHKRFEDAAEQRRKDKDDLMNKLDYLIGKYEAAEQDSIIGTHQIRELRERLDEHDKVLKNIQQH
ncbi:MAG TPA: hypothetical protein VLG12_03545 [Candidatus Saccharimonadales bacterium]|nr:hypothetical protein [Candidatus Saccharimonadales bacterium]